MARHKYYVVQDQKVPRNARDPFKYFRGDARGQPWTEFADLVDHRNAEKGDDAQTHRVRRAGAAPARSDDLYEEDEAPPARRRVREAPAREPPPPAETEAPAEAEAPPAEPEATEQPECFAQYTGTAPCARCAVRARCIAETEDDDM